MCVRVCCMLYIENIKQQVSFSFSISFMVEFHLTLDGENR